LNTLVQRFLFLALLGCASLLLPACGSNNGAVKSQKNSETVLNPENSSSNGTADIGIPGEHSTSVNTYVEKVGRSKKKSGATASVSSSTPLATTQTTPNQTPAMDPVTPVKKTGKSSKLLWLLLVPILAGIGWYFWSKNQPHDHPSQPMPPVGGLSPVSGFTAVKDQIEDESAPETSFWFKKLF
jgi:hypothetical protein